MPLQWMGLSCGRHCPYLMRQLVGTQLTCIAGWSCASMRANTCSNSFARLMSQEMMSNVCSAQSVSRMLTNLGWMCIIVHQFLCEVSRALPPKATRCFCRLFTGGCVFWRQLADTAEKFLRVLQSFYYWAVCVRLTLFSTKKVLALFIYRMSQGTIGWSVNNY